MHGSSDIIIYKISVNIAYFTFHPLTFFPFKFLSKNHIVKMWLIVHMISVNVVNTSQIRHILFKEGKQKSSFRNNECFNVAHNK
jgi:hypothetical protein